MNRCAACPRRAGSAPVARQASARVVAPLEPIGRPSRPWQRREPQAPRSCRIARERADDGVQGLNHRQCSPDEDEPRAVPTGGDNDEQAQEHERAAAYQLVGPGSATIVAGPNPTLATAFTPITATGRKNAACLGAVMRLGVLRPGSDDHGAKG